MVILIIVELIVFLLVVIDELKKEIDKFRFISD